VNDVFLWYERIILDEGIAPKVFKRLSVGGVMPYGPVTTLDDSASDGS